MIPCHIYDSIVGQLKATVQHWLNDLLGHVFLKFYFSCLLTIHPINIPGTFGKCTSDWENIVYLSMSSCFA